MESVNLRLINNRKGKGSEKVASSVELRITYQRKVKYISTGVKVTTSEWKDGRVVKRGDAFELNERINKLYGQVSKVIRIMEEEGCIDLQAIPTLIKTKGTTITFWEYIENRTYEKMGVDDVTRKRYEYFLKWLQEHNMFKTFADITEGNIKRMDDELHDAGLKQATIYGSYHKHLKMFIADAVIDGYIRENPYITKRIKIERGEGRIDKYLTDKELECIKKVRLVGSLAIVRDCFVFACYTGLSFADLVEFSKDDIKERDGIKMVTGHRSKTGKEYMFVLLHPAIEILEKYDYKLPMISNQKYNDYLKVVALRAKVEKSITSHWARHTAAMQMLNNGVSIEIVSKVLGHASIRTTQNYYAMVKEKAVAREMQEYGEKIQ